MPAFEQAFKDSDDVLWKEAGCSSELDYTEQTSWLLFLKYLDGLEQDLADQAALGKLDYSDAMTGDDLRDFVKLKLFPYLHGFRQRATGPNTIQYKIGEIFGEINNTWHATASTGRAST